MAIQQEQIDRAINLAKAYGATRLILPLDLVPLSPPTSFTRLIERRGKVLL